MHVGTHPLVSNMSRYLVSPATIQETKLLGAESTYDRPASATVCTVHGAVNPHHVRELLTKYVESVEDFCTMLYSTGSAVTGSTATQMLLGEVYKDSDLDVYAPPQTLGKMLDYLLRMGYELTLEYKPTAQPQPPAPGDVSLEETYFGPGSKLCYKLRNKARSTSVDVLTYRMPEQCAYSVQDLVLSFDLTCCMGFFNGSELYTYYYELTVAKVAVSVLPDEEGIYVRRRSCEREAKYKGRGFSVIHTVADIPHTLVPHINARLDKLPKLMSASHYGLSRDEVRAYNQSSDTRLGTLVNAYEMRESMMRLADDPESEADQQRQASAARLTKAIGSLAAMRLNREWMCLPMSEVQKYVRQHTLGSDATMDRVAMILEEIGIPFARRNRHRSLYCGVSRCDFDRYDLCKELGDMALVPPGEHELPVYSRGGQTYREMTQGGYDWGRHVTG